MGQKVEFNSKGINIIELGLSVKDLNTVDFRNIKEKIDLNHLIGMIDAENDFKYYYIVSDSIFIEKGGIVKDIFFAIDKAEKITGIILMFEHISEDIIPVINTIFGEPNVKSKSSTGEKAIWKKNDVSLLLSVYSDGKSAKINIYNTSINESFPDISNFIYHTFD